VVALTEKEVELSGLGLIVVIVGGKSLVELEVVRGGDVVVPAPSTHLSRHVVHSIFEGGESEHVVRHQDLILVELLHRILKKGLVIGLLADVGPEVFPDVAGRLALGGVGVLPALEGGVGAQEPAPLVDRAVGDGGRVDYELVDLGVERGEGVRESGVHAVVGIMRPLEELWEGGC
jgi:hypothetical protein